MLKLIPISIIALMLAIFMYLEKNPVLVYDAVEIKSNGVSIYFVHDGGRKRSAEGVEKIVNNNDYTVIIRCVWQFQGESTQWVDILKSNQTKIINVSHQHGFYIYTDTQPQKLIGFISPETPTKHN